ncbi:MAG: hypothetical protein ACHQVS_04000 [Candidatus Babeliales bacterium]
MYMFKQMKYGVVLALALQTVLPLHGGVWNTISGWFSPQSRNTVYAVSAAVIACCGAFGLWKLFSARNRGDQPAADVRAPQPPTPPSQPVTTTPPTSQLGLQLDSQPNQEDEDRLFPLVPGVSTTFPVLSTQMSQPAAQPVVQPVLQVQQPIMQLPSALPTPQPVAQPAPAEQPVQAESKRSAAIAMEIAQQAGQAAYAAGSATYSATAHAVGVVADRLPTQQQLVETGSAAAHAVGQAGSLALTQIQETAPVVGRAMANGVVAVGNGVVSVAQTAGPVLVDGVRRVGNGAYAAGNYVAAYMQSVDSQSPYGKFKARVDVVAAQGEKLKEIESQIKGLNHRYDTATVEELKKKLSAINLHEVQQLRQDGIALIGHAAETELATIRRSITCLDQIGQTYTHLDGQVRALDRTGDFLLQRHGDKKNRRIEYCDGPMPTNT